MRAGLQKVAWGQVEPGGAILLLLCPEGRAPESAKYRAPAPEPNVKPRFGRAPAEAAPRAADVALLNGPELRRALRGSDYLQNE
jgi:hypothetical protein